VAVDFANYEEFTAQSSEVIRFKTIFQLNLSLSLFCPDQASSLNSKGGYFASSMLAFVIHWALLR